MRVSDVVCCINCRKKLQIKKGMLYCGKCNSFFPIEDGVIDFNKKDDKLVREYQNFTKKSDSYGFNKAPEIVRQGHNRKIGILTMLFKGYDLKNKKILDVGAGEDIPGFLKGCRIGIIQDISKNVLKRSKEIAEKEGLGDRFIFITSNQNLPCFSGSVDIIFAGEIIEHVKDPARFVAELFRVLKPKGKLVLTTPNSKALVFRLLGFKYSKCGQHISLQDYASLTRLLGKKFKIKCVYGFNQSFFHYVDRLIKNKKICRIWARLFFGKPRYATNLIVECEK